MIFKGFRATGEFTVPLELGRQGKLAELDRISFADWLKAQKITSKLPTWYMNYCCRDDYGALASDTSAWAGVHYFASREPDEKGPLTWPEGNGWIVRRMLERLASRVRTNAPVHLIRQRGNGYSVFAAEIEYQCDAVVYAAPTFLGPYVIEGMAPLQDFEYSPWLTANITIDPIPPSAQNTVTWDNVVVESPTLGYVDARHQSVNTYMEKTVWTFYWALAEGSPAANRQFLLQKDWSYWRDAILHDLERVHPDIRSSVTRIDIMRHGHAMIRPKVGAIYSAERRKLAQRKGRLLFANSDLSGFSIFEEAQYRGIRAANGVLEIYKA
jgi:hypothetical protein